MHPKEADAMANSVDPDQTASSEAVWSWSALFAETYLSQYIEFLRYVFWKCHLSLAFPGARMQNVLIISILFHVLTMASNFMMY